MLCQCVPHDDLLIDMPEGRVMVRLGRAAESEFPAPMLRSPMCSTLVDVDVALGPGSVASVVRYCYWKKGTTCTTVYTGVYPMYIYIYTDIGND